MSDADQTFRIVLIAGTAALFPIVVYHRIRSQSTGERLDRWQEGRFILFTLRPVGIACMLSAVAFMIDPAWMAWSSVPLPRWLRWTGVAIGVGAGVLLVWTLRSLGRNLTDTVVTRKAHRLVTIGPYRWIRHPFYVAVAGWMLATALIAANWFVFVTGGVALFLIGIRTRTEEAHLVNRFGNDYRDYMSRTGRFVPRPR